ncbi:primosomal protein N' [Candidatus Acetothermia bacterium]|nr:primosomal protein N' [Candidatus Acetothermia bacterium]MBI3642492.1 primosomal protein N' [Candidatus Acetothermia bacterium]
MENSIAEIAVPRDIDKTFDYRIPEHFQSQIERGMRVRIPFRDEELTGFVVALKPQSSFKGRLAFIKNLIDEEPVVDEPGFQLAHWISEHYLCPLGIALPALVPSLLQRRKARMRNIIHLKTDLEETLRWIEKLSSSSKSQANLLKALLTRKSEPSARELLAELHLSDSPLKSLEQKGIIAIVRRPISYNVKSAYHEGPFQYALNAEQREALEAILQALDRSEGTFLLHGVNASGKTEIYLRAVHKALEMGKQAIVAVPEISLTPQLIARFRSRFGERLAVYHSQLTSTERSHEWERIRDAEVDVVIGVRSVLFSPLARLGLMIMDEEHEPTYKQDDPAPRYHARDVALQRAKISKAVVILGSATPSLETYWRSQKGGIQRLELKERVITGSQPLVKVVDLGREEHVLSPRLQQAITQRLHAGEQVLLLLNLRGFSRCVLCKDCRTAQKCPRCGIALVYHLREQRLDCHFCGHSYSVGRCQKCQSQDLKFIGAGTEQAELILREAFPNVSIVRMDSDSVRRGEHGAILESFRKGEIQILVGTQMIGLGLDFPNLTLVGILSADTLLNLPDFRAGERTFQLISQAIGRAGRGLKPGEVIIQTNHPNHYAIQKAARGDYVGFYQEELAFRESLGYPPFTHLVKIVSEDRSAERAKEQTEHLAAALQEAALHGLEVLGPFQGLPYRLRGEYRWQLVIKTKDLSSTNKILADLLGNSKSSVQTKIDVDPQSLLF